MTSDAAIRDWLFHSALPLWSTRGVDRERGGFFEQLSPEGSIIEVPRRTRLVGRQIYCFATATRLGWDGPGEALVAHGLDFLFGRLLLPSGGVAATFDVRTGVLDPHFDLYDHAFALFALAAAMGVAGRDAELADRAAAMRDHIIGGWSHPDRGFEESAPRTLPLKANPHMHMLEAALAWVERTDDPAWNALADMLAELCIAAFIDEATGALHEYFDGNWQRSAQEAVVEPGHQFEWGWLLIRWGRMRGRNDAIAIARRLIELAEAHGVCKRQGLARNELTADLEVQDGRHRLWPQTERLKAAVATGWIADGPAEKTSAAHRRTTALTGLMRFTGHPIEGSWWEHLDTNGTPEMAPARGSSLYHIMCAFAELSAEAPAIRRPA